MPMEFSSGAVVFRGKKPLYLLLLYEKGHWDFPKGHIEKGESAQQAAIRETREETGISDLKFVDGFKEKIGYFFRQDNKLIHKEVTYFLAETKTSKVVLSFEHKGYEWLPIEEALKRTTFKSSREVLKKADGFLKLSSRSSASASIGGIMK